MSPSPVVGGIALQFGTILGLLAAEQTPVQQTMTSTAGVVVVVIPGFPIESLLLGLLAGLMVVVLVRLRHRQRVRGCLDW